MMNFEIEFLYKIGGYILLSASVASITYHYNNRFLDWLRFQSIGTRDYVLERLNLMFIDVQPNRVLFGMFGLSLGLGLLLFLIWWPIYKASIIFGSIGIIIGWKLPKPIVDYMYRKRVEKFTLQMVDALSLMSNGMRSGLSIVQSMSLVKDQMPNPIQQEFGRVLNQNKLGASLEDAFLSLSKRIKSDDVEMFVTSVNILKETGGNLAETFDTIVVTIRERIRVEKKIEAMTAQQFMQGVFLLAVPPVMAIVFYQTDPEFMEPIFTTPVGWGLLVAIIALEAIATFVIMKIVKIDV